MTIFTPVNMFQIIFEGWRSTENLFLFDVVLTVHLSIFISVINQPDAKNFILQ